MWWCNVTKMMTETQGDMNDAISVTISFMVQWNLLHYNVISIMLQYDVFFLIYVTLGNICH